MRHRRVWVEHVGLPTHPEGCAARQTVCETCGCCEHCFHPCDCKACSCHEISGDQEPVLRTQTA